ncbi:adenylate/guanylate cyclase domain-containing protein [Mesorhizobium sp. NZP2077]|uniref:adenylate/guanylate cyclase domain-containing protein n=1 Tax=Mesorhizobium sp. NZP2077 TaxID=2483404 RepID=UPI001557D263|nr:adenylate/guanylate cyclase domain-containing protein [Mesorhizobium sp. NZP2077]QKC80850.1 adenylate/guanylate cyclase domain-containing protein [Mesorhizobium sp. NZP2077]QKD14251.1 adenylate/guanylate cyclase domain-containing protein [Mesorhizobium sp. NZP2077]
MSETRKIAAILVSDVVGYSRLAGADEDRILARLRALRSDLIDPTIAVHRGRVVKRTGDGSLVEFSSVVEAVRCAIEVQNAMIERNAGVPPDRRIEFRIGIHVGDIVEESDGDLMGDGVNIAARLEGIAEPNGICLSGAAYEQVRDKLKEEFEDLGDQELKNIARPVRAYRVALSRYTSSEPIVPGLSGGKLALPDKPSIAVLPFHNMSGDPEQEYFGDGIAEDIITALSKLRGLFVIARNSTFAYKGKAPDIRQVARELGVRYVLEGSVRKAGERLRVTGQLIDAASGNHIWAERYDRPTTDIFALQDEITASVVAAIEPQLYAADNLRLRSKPTESLDAWGCVVRAMPYIWVWVSQKDDTGINLLKRAIELDPGYARAHCLLAWIFASRVQLGTMDHERGISDSLTLAQHAIDLDPEDPWAHLAAGYVFTFARRTGPAVEELNEALQRNPSFAIARVFLALAYGYAGLAEDGYRQLEIATRLSPRDYLQAANLSTEGLCHLVAHRYDEAVVAERRAVQLRPDFGTAWRTLASAAGLAGDLELARQGLAECKRLQPNVSIAWVEKYYPLIRTEDRSRYIDGLRRAGLE